MDSDPRHQPQYPYYSQQPQHVYISGTPQPVAPTTPASGKARPASSAAIALASR